MAQPRSWPGHLLVLSPWLLQTWPMLRLSEQTNTLCQPQTLLPLWALSSGALAAVWGLAYGVRRDRDLATSVALGAVLLAWYAPASPAGAAQFAVEVVLSVALLHRVGGLIREAALQFTFFLAALLLLSSSYSALAPRLAPSWRPLATLPLWTLDRRPASPPDIWHIVLDGYGREDVLRDRFGWEDPLAPGLRARGFAVGATTNANYCQTNLSILSVLSGAHLDALTPGPAEDYDRRSLLSSFADARVVRSLASAGYTITEHRGEYSSVWLSPDELVQPTPHFSVSSYYLLSTSLLSPLSLALGGTHDQPSHLLRMRHVRHQLSHLHPSEDRGPRFHYVHLLSPHPGFLFDEQGRYNPDATTAQIADANRWATAHEERGDVYGEGYARQATWLAGQVLQAVDQLLAESATPPVIILHGDHGSRSGLDWEDVDGSDVTEALGVLLAVYAPPEMTAGLYSGMTLVNLYPSLLSSWGELPLQPDRSYYSPWSNPLHTVDVTARLQRPAPAALTEEAAR
ncbi:MAG: hypothetical protein JXX28_14300 [Deltaproteobacteria bacterium]|nr:hypothetical protein [Deltaproteobacteria bacterium]